MVIPSWQIGVPHWTKVCTPSMSAARCQWRPCASAPRHWHHDAIARFAEHGYVGYPTQFVHHTTTLDPWYQNSINSTSKIWIDRWPSWLGMVRHGSTRSLEASLSFSSASSSFRFLDLGAMDGPSPEMSRAKVGLESSRATSVLNE